MQDLYSDLVKKAEKSHSLIISISINEFSINSLHAYIRVQTHLRVCEYNYSIRVPTCVWASRVVGS